ncbi:hypothetical protein PV10_03958 [Exophiala mesophila]|uniref:Uncharacterized protein n=1 Tax=Exophiala mesophila TaxID=212818 RepID=A0A0D1XWT4_EXOME|nr:uncharacterized protein PV10_03958 [Exophiala mesophila]KIV92686.1 hypothetical protein PV10_03958 [Exophiala mesophila]
MPSSTRPKFTDYTIGWVCALPLELAASLLMFDERHEAPLIPYRDDQNYHFGRIGRHNVVLTCLPSSRTGTNAAASVARDMMRTFPISIVLIVGIAGGIPSEEHDIRLGDVVIAKPQEEHGGVIQYDFGRQSAGVFAQSRWLNRPPQKVLGVLSTMEALSMSDSINITQHVDAAAARVPSFGRPDLSRHPDNLFKATYNHRGRPSTSCHHCNALCRVTRNPRPHSRIQVHHGNVLSGNTLMRDALERDRLGSDFQALCFEMETAGLYETCPALVVRGICDYADSHKNKAWQNYAALTAAAYAKEVLHYMNPIQAQLSSETVALINTVATYEEQNSRASLDLVMSVPKKLDAVTDWVSHVASTHESQTSQPSIPSIQLPQNSDSREEISEANRTASNRLFPIARDSMPLGFVFELTGSASDPLPEQSELSTDVQEWPGTTISDYKQLQLQAFSVLHNLVVSYVKQSGVYSQVSSWVKAANSLPRPMSMLLSDNIILTDAANNNHSLPFQYFQDWNTFNTMIKNQFQGHPGYQKIASDQFCISMVDSPDFILNGQNWKNVKPRSKLTMDIKFQNVAISVNECPICKKSLLSDGGRSWQCRSCGVSYTKLDQTHIEADASSLRQFGPGSKRRQLADGFLKAPSTLPSLNLYAAYDGGAVDTSQARLTNSLGVRRDLPRTAEGFYEVSIPVEPSTSEKGSVMVNWSKVRDDLKRQRDEEEEDPFDESVQDTGEMRLFKRVRVQEETDLYQAVLNPGQDVSKRLQRCRFVDNEQGPWGTALTAAVLSGSQPTVKDLLAAGADPLLERGPLGSPVRAAALHGHDAILFDLFLAAKQRLQRGHHTAKRARQFFEGLQSALRIATVSHRTGCIHVLCFFGANPFAAGPNDLSPFLDSVRLHHDIITTYFLDEALHRGLLTTVEFQLVKKAIDDRHNPDPDPSGVAIDEDGVKRHIDRLDAELADCAEQIVVGRGRKLQSWINTRIRIQRPWEWIGGGPGLERFLSTDSDRYGPLDEDDDVMNTGPEIRVTPP